MKNKRLREYGVTLVELLVVVAMVAILSMIAYPNYSDYLQRARRMDAKTALQHIATMQERSFVTNFSYTSNLAQLGFISNETDDGFYVITVPTADIRGFQAIAVPAPGSPQAKDDDCQQFSIDHEQTRDAAPDPDGKCW
jgi:type IV pilus assembly protein PilE